MATDKNFVIKNGLTVGTTEIIDSSGNLVNSSGSISGTTITGSDRGTFEDLVLTGDADDDLTFTVSAGDWSILNSQQSNGLVIYDGTAGVQLLYNNTVKLEILDGGIDVENGTISIAGTEFADASRNVSAGTIDSGAITATGTISLSAASGAELRVKDTTNDAQVVVLAQDNDGWIGTASNHPLKIGTSYSGRLLLEANGSALRPNSTSTVPDLGTSSYPFGSIYSGEHTITQTSDTSIGFKINRYTATGRSQMVLADQNGSDLWRIGLTGAGSEDFTFFDGGANVLLLDRSSDTAFFSGAIAIGSTTVIDSSRNISNIADYHSDGRLQAASVHGENTHTGAELLFEITDYDDDTSLKRKFGQNDSNSNFSKANDSDAPASGVFDVSNAVSPIYGPYIPIDDETEIIFECWAKHISGTDTTGNFYAGSQFYDGSQASLGNNSRYWGANGDALDADNTSWRFIRGVMRGDGIRALSATSTSKYLRFLTLFNYNTTGQTTRYCGFKFYRSKKTVTSLWLKTNTATNYQDSGWDSLESTTANLVVGHDQRIYGNSTGTNTTPQFTFASDTNTGLGYITTDSVGLIAGGSRKFYVNGTNAYFQNLTGGVDVPSLSIAGTSVIDSSRNLTNIGTINSGAITSTGTSEFANLNLGGVTSTGSSYLSGTQRIVSDGYIATQAIYNYGETGSSPAAIVFGNGSTYGTDQISFVTGGITALYIDSSQNITVAGTVDGRDLATDGSKLDGISAGADVTPSWVPSTNPNYLTGITSSQVTTALGYTPYQESTALSATTGAFSSTLNVDGELRLDARYDNSNGDNVLAFKDSGGNYSIRHNVNDGNGNYSISLGYSGTGVGQYEVTGDGVGKILFGGHGRDGAISLNAAPTGTAGNNISFSIGLLVDGDDNTIRVGASANGTGMDTGAGTKVFDASGNAFATSYSVSSTTVIDSSRNLVNIGTVACGSITTTNNAHLTLYTSSSDTGTGGVDLPRGGHITFYGNGNVSHSIGSRNSAGAIADDLRISSYASLYIDLDSNGNNSSGADFVIGRHGGGTGTMSTLVTISGETGNITTTGDLTISGGTLTNDTGTILDSDGTSNYIKGGSGGSGILYVEGSQLYSSAPIRANSTLNAYGKVNIGSAAFNARDMLTLQTNDNTSDRGISFQNSGGAYSNSIFAEDVGGNDARLVFTGGNAASTLTSLSRDFMINNQSGGGGVQGDIHARGDVVAFSTTVTSDERLKYDIQNIENPLEIIKSLTGRHFKWKKNDAQSSGVIAQEVEKTEMSFLVAEKCDIEDPDKTIKRVKYDGFIGVLIEAIKEQQKQIEELKEEVSSLRSKN